MTDAVQLLTLVICITGLILIALLIVLALHALRLVRDVQRRLDSEVSPLIARATETLAKVNSATTRLSQTLDLLGSVGSVASSTLAKLSPATAGRAAAVQTGRTVATWAARLARAFIAGRQRTQPGEADTPAPPRR